MRLDPDHVRKLVRAASVDADGKPHVNFDIDFLMSAIDRLNLWERGLLMQVLLKAALAKRRSPEQRALLAIFVHDEGKAESEAEPCPAHEIGPVADMEAEGLVNG
jgi:hypothetical protein